MNFDILKKREMRSATKTGNFNFFIDAFCFGECYNVPIREGPRQKMKKISVSDLPKESLLTNLLQSGIRHVYDAYFLSIVGRVSLANQGNSCVHNLQNIEILWRR